MKRPGVGVAKEYELRTKVPIVRGAYEKQRGRREGEIVGGSKHSIGHKIRVTIYFSGERGKVRFRSRNRRI